MASVFGRTITVPREELTSIARRPVLLAIAVAVLGILLVHAETADSIVGIWMRSETFAHGFFVLPLAIWLVWQRRAKLETLVARPWYPGIGLVLLFGAAWLAATLSDVQAGRQFALLFMIEGAILAIVGLAVARQIAFPLLFLWFAVPFGEFLIPSMIDWTADFTIAALRASGVPVYREANHFVIPSGSWSVVEACSGIRYLIVSVMVGTLYAMISYRSVQRRALFIAASIAVPLVANWLRAYGIVMLGHLSNNRLAVGVDHLIYGWLFFGLVMVLLFFIGSLFHEPPQDRVQPAQSLRKPMLGTTSAGGLFFAATLAVVAAGVWRPLPAWIESARSDAPVTLATINGAGGWVPAPTEFSAWKPRFEGHAAESRQSFAAGEQVAGLYIAYYRHQQEGRELVSSKNALVTKRNWSWKLVESSVEPITWNGREVDARRAVLAGAEGQLGVYQLYWIDGTLTASDWVAKFLSAWANLSGAGDDAALVVFYAPLPDANGWASLQRFVADVTPELARTLAATKRGTP